MVWDEMRRDRWVTWILVVGIGNGGRRARARRVIIRGADQAYQGFEEGSRRAHGSGTGCQQGSVAGSRSQSRQEQEGEQHERMRTAECNGKPLHIR